jgi:glycosyltransferase involved in cell wall biosynthesis
MESLRIAFVYDVVYPWVKGGVEKRIYELAVRLARFHEVHVYGYRHWGGSSSIEREGIHYHGLARPGRTYLLGKRNPMPMLRLASNVSRRTDELRRYDVLDLQNLFYPGALALAQLPNAVVTWHEFWGRYWFTYLGPAGLIGWLAEERLFSAERHLAVSMKTKLDLRRAGLGKPVSLVPNGVDVGLIDAVPPAELESDVIFVGRLVRGKGVDVLLRALSELKREIPDVRAVIVGDGPERAKLELRAKRLGLEGNVLFVGFLEDYTRVLALMKSSKVFVLPSRREGFGIVALEAMASGLPVVTIDAPMNAARFLVEDGKTGLVVPEEKLAEALSGLLDGDYLTLGRRGREFSKAYDWDNVVRTWENAVGELFLF